MILSNVSVIQAINKSTQKTVYNALTSTNVKQAFMFAILMLNVSMKLERIPAAAILVMKAMAGGANHLRVVKTSDVVRTLLVLKMVSHLVDVSKDSVEMDKDVVQFYLTVAILLIIAHRMDCVL